MPQMTGYRFFAEMLKAYNVGTVFWMPAILKAGLMEIERVGGIKRVLCHSEKGAAYMADGDARASRRPGIAMCQSVGAAKYRRTSSHDEGKGLLMSSSLIPTSGPAESAS